MKKTPNRLSAQAVKKIEEGFDLNREAWQLLDLIVVEFETDPHSVTCFDLRIVERAKYVVKRRKQIDKDDPFPMLG